MSTFDWPSAPIVSLHAGRNVPSITWHGSRSAASLEADTLEIKVKISWEGPNGGWAFFDVWLDSNSESMQEPVWHEKDHHREYVQWSNGGDATHDYDGSITTTLSLPLSSRFLQFRVRVSVDQLGMTTAEWPDKFETERVFVAYVDYLGDVTLRYLPVGLVYSPPGQDMYQTHRRATETGVVTRFRFAETNGTASSSSTTVSGGSTINFGAVSGGTDNSSTWTQAEKSTISEATSETISFGNRWTSGVTADNRTTIGRRYWGPLGDVFVLLRNAAFSLSGDAEGNLNVGPSDRAADAEVVCVPAHLLLRPEGHPVAEQINAHERRQLLELDPFFVNLDPFFPDEGEADPSIPLEDAIDPYRSPLDAGPNGALSRATFIARYGVGPGVDLDLSLHEKIELAHSESDSRSYYAEVGSSTSGVLGLSFLLGLSFGGQGSSSQFVEVNYEDSFEAILNTIHSATCRLVRNQNQASTDDIEIWWDRHFSTFLFRLVKPDGRVLKGRILGSKRRVLANIAVTLVSLERDSRPIPDDLLERAAFVRGLPADRVLHTLTDERGRYRFPGLKAGQYAVLAGNAMKTVDIQANGGEVVVDLREVVRVVNLRSLRSTEMRQVFGWTQRQLGNFRDEVLSLPLTAQRKAELEERHKLRRHAPDEPFLLLYACPVRAGRCTVEGWAVGPSGRRQAFLPVELGLGDDQPARLGRTNEHGYFIFADVPAGKHQIRAGDQAVRVDVAEGELQKGLRRTVTIRDAVRQLDAECDLAGVARALTSSRLDGVRALETLSAARRAGPGALQDAISQLLRATNDDARRDLRVRRW